MTDPQDRIESLEEQRDVMWEMLRHGQPNWGQLKRRADVKENTQKCRVLKFMWHNCAFEQYNHWYTSRKIHREVMGQDDGPSAASKALSELHQRGIVTRRKRDQTKADQSKYQYTITDFEPRDTDFEDFENH